MAIRNAFSRLICGCFLLLFLLSACRKEENQETVVKIRCVMPHNDQPIQGCQVIITEGKMKSQGLNVDFETIQQFSGITDANGVATIKFHYKKKNKFQYALSYDYSGIVPPNGLTSLDIKLPFGWTSYLDKKQFEFDFKFKVFGRCNIHQKFENVDCFDQYDSIRWIRKNLSEYTTSDPFYMADFNNKFTGCGVVYEGTTTSGSFLTGKYVYKLEISKGGVQTIRYDTIVFYPNVINEVIIEY